MDTWKRIRRVGWAAPALALVVALSLFSRPVTVASPGAAGTLTPLTRGGCCTRPFWSADSQHVLYIDKPDASAPVGIYGVDIAQPGAPKLVTPRIALYTHGMSLVIEPGPGSTTLERVSDGKRWSVPADGALVTVSPSKTRIAWTEGSAGASPEARVTRIRAANFDGSGEKTVASVRGGSIGGWISDDVLLVGGRGAPATLESVLYRLSIATGELTELARAENLRGPSLSPDGTWVAFNVAPNPDPDENGLWVAQTDGSGRFRAPPDLFGPYQWRDARRLLIIPFNPTAESHEFWELDATTQQARRLTDPAVTPFKINDGDWVVAPDGRQVAFVSARDRNLWLLSLPE